MSSADFQPKPEPQVENQTSSIHLQASTSVAAISESKPIAAQKPAFTPGGGMFGAVSAETTELGGGKSQTGHKKAMVLGKAKKLATNNITFE